MTEQELEFWKQVYVSVITGSLYGSSSDVAKQADAAVRQLREREKNVMKPIEPML